MDNATLGQRLAAIRRRRRISQPALAAAAEVSVDLIRKLEQQQRHSARLDSLVRLANALDVPLAELLGKNRGLVVGGENSEVLELRRAVIGVDPNLVDDPPTVAVLRAGIGDLWRLYWTGHYAALARELPGALARARGAARALPVDAQRTAQAVVAELLQISASLLAHLAYEDLAHVALLHAITAAEQADDPLLRASQQATLTWIMTLQGMWGEAEHLANAAAADVEPTLSRASAEQLAVWGELLRYATTAVARSGRKPEAEEMLGLVTAAAAAMGDRRPRYTGVIPFGPTIAGMAAVGIAVATDEPRRALQLAERVDDIGATPLAIQARYLLNVAYAQTMDWKSQEAVDTLRRVEQMAPELMPNQTITRAIVEELRPRQRTQRLVGLSAITERLGIAAA